jgi:hypothetical protein
MSLQMNRSKKHGLQANAQRPRIVYFMIVMSFFWLMICNNLIDLQQFKEHSSTSLS